MSVAALWLIAALVLAGLEMVSGTFYLLAVAIGLASGAFTAWLSTNFAIQISVASVVGVIMVILLHQWKKNHLPKPSRQQNVLDIGQRVNIESWTDAQHARVLYRGTRWDAELASSASSGLDVYYIHDVHGSTLIIHQNKPE